MTPNHNDPCIHTEDVQDLYKKMEKGGRQLNRIEKQLTQLCDHLSFKKRLDSERNGKIEKIGIKSEQEDEKLHERVVALEKMMIAAEKRIEKNEDLQDKILKLLQGVAVGFTIFFITFMFKTIILGI